MDIPASLREIYPDAPPCEVFGGGDTPWIVRDDGHGPFISNWNYSKPQPTDVELALAWISVQKKRQWEKIKAERDRRKENGGYKVTVDGSDKWFHSDTFSRSQQLGLVALGANIPSGLLWKTMDDTYVTMNAELAAQVLASGSAQDVATFMAAEKHKATMEAMEDPSAYDYSGEWPTIYEDVERS